MSDPRRVGLLFGGRSVEHEVSVVSARGVDLAIARASRLTAVPIGVTGDGRWLSPDASRRVLDSRAKRVEAEGEDDGVRVLIDPGSGGLVRRDSSGVTTPLAIDVLFPLIHGWGGEDGRLQGALELAGVAYVGAGVLASAAGMDKAVAKEIFAAHGIDVVPWVLVTRAGWAKHASRLRERVRDELGFPVFVKPANGGSSVGVSKARGPEELDPAILRALEHDRRVVVERGVDAREIECAVLGNDEPEASGLGEIVPGGEFYDYAAKYLDTGSTLTIPADLPADAAARIRDLALRAYLALDLCGFARVDFLVDRGTGRPYLNEVNTLPGFTPISMFPKLWEAQGLPFERQVERLVDLALERARETSNRTSKWDGR